jgi:hypothetical protein
MVGMLYYMYNLYCTICDVFVRVRIYIDMCQILYTSGRPPKPPGGGGGAARLTGLATVGESLGTRRRRVYVTAPLRSIEQNTICV